MSAILPPEKRVWWKEPVEKIELWWIALALVWALILFFMMPYWHVYGDSFPLPQLVNPLKELLTGSPPEEESLTQLLDRVRILCTVYDPVTGQYRYKYSILLEIAGGLFSVSAVGVFLLRELRKTRLARSPPGS